jgi:DNA-binding MarR family transcriptional regulator/acylphosphatase
MDAVTTDAMGASYSALPPVLIAADTQSAASRAARTVEASGLRIGASLAIAEAPERIELQPAASAIWVELDADGGESMDRLLDAVDREAAGGRCGCVVAAPAELIDALVSRIGDGAVEIVIDGNEADRAAALAIVTSGAHRARRLSDVASDQSAERLRQLSDEVSRIASTLARLSAGPAAPQRPNAPAANEDVPPVSAETVRSIIRARRLRSRYFDSNLFADPAWDMLLDLLQAEVAQLRVPVSSLCIAAAVPATTALRWLKTMTSQGLFVRRADPHDGRRVFVELAPQTSIALRRYFAEVGAVAVI